MADWMEQQVSEVDDGDNDVKPKSAEEFSGQLRTMLATNSVEKLAVSLLRERVPEVEDVEALEAALEADGREDAQVVYRDRLDELGELEEADPGDTEEPAPEETDESEEAEEAEDTEDEEQTEEPEEAEDDTDEEESEDSTPNPFGDSGSDEAEEEADADEADSEDSPADTGTDEPDEPVEPETPDTPDPTPTEAAETDGGPQADESGDTANIDVKSIAPDVMTADEAAERQRRFTMLVWADPGQGKTHFACTGPDPVVVIDTEGKADEVAGKFRGEGRVAESPFIFQPTDYDEALEALHSALDILDEYRTKADMTGTLVVDSMSVMWGWSQQKYVDKFYPGKDAEEVEFSSAIGGGQSDWKQIKRYHNVKFRQVMLDSPYHLIWTAMREDDYEERMKGNRDADKPAGEKENIYKVDELLRIKEGDDGAPVGVLNKSGKIKHRYAGLRYPTFDKHRDLIDAILDAENGTRSVEAVGGEQGVRIHEGNPNYEKSDE